MLAQLIEAAYTEARVTPPDALPLLAVLVVTGATAKTGASIDRRYRLPRDADVEKATAAHVDGVLTITLPKKAAPKPKSIAIAGIQKAAEDDKDEDGVMV